VTYAVSVRRRQRRGSLGPPALALGNGLGQDDGSGFDWSNFATSVASSAATSAAAAGVNLLKNVGAPKAPTVMVAPPTTASTLGLPSTVPVYVWALGGLGLVMILVLAMRR